MASAKEYTQVNITTKYRIIFEANESQITFDATLLITI